MDFEETPHSESLIDTKESHELYMGHIERTGDNTPNTFEDLRIFTEEQAVQAKDMLRKKAKNLAGSELDGEELKLILERSEELVDHYSSMAIEVASISAVREVCSLLSDLVGFTAEVDVLGLDQFGLPKRHSQFGMERGTGFIGYDEEQVDTTEIPSGLESVRRIKKMREYDTPKRSVTSVLAVMRKHGTAKYEQFPEAESGPVIVLLPEMHYDSGILQNNFDVVLGAQEHVALLATEGSQGEITQDDIGAEGTGTHAENRQRIIKHEVGLSSSAIEDVLGDEIYTLGTEQSGTLRYVLREMQQKMKGLQEAVVNDPAVLKQLKELAVSVFEKDNITKFDMLELAKAMESIIFDDNFSKRFVVDYRNQIWLNRIQEALLEERGKLSSESNMVFVVCGEGHTEDLAREARTYGFKGVIRFTPSSFNDALDPETISAYVGKQMGL